MSNPVDAARTLHARGVVYEAEVMVLAALARDPSDADARSAAMAIRRGQRLGPASNPAAMDLALVDRWIRRGMLVEALALLVAGPFEQSDARVSEWAELLGELLAPVPAHTEPVFVEMHRQLLRGGATVALAVLEDRRAEGPLPPWAERRLSLLRWMLLDNAQTAADEEVRAAPSPLAEALMPGLEQRSLLAARGAVEAFVAAHPEDGEAREVHAALGALIEEMNTLGDIDLKGVQTVPVMGRPAAAMQLQMASLKGAASLYRKLSSGQVRVPEARGLLYSVETVLRALEARAEPEQRFPRPRDGFDDVTKPRSAEARAMAASPMAQRGTFDEPEGPTRVAQRGEMPLAAFDDSQTRDVHLPDFGEYEDTGEIDPSTLPAAEEVDAGGEDLVSSCGTFMDTDKTGMAEAVASLRGERDFEDGPTVTSTAPLSGEMTMVDVDVEVDDRPRAQGDVIVARVIKVGDR